MKKILFTTVCNDEYATGGHVMLYSMKTHIKEFEQLCDVKIYWNKKIAPLSVANRKKFQKISSNITFECVDEEKYYKGKTTDNRSEGCKSAYLALESFKEYEYHRVIMFDIDMLWIGDTCPICEFSDERFKADLTMRGMNTGFVVINKKCRTPEIYKELTDKIVDHNGRAMDQGIINNYFQNEFVSDKERDDLGGRWPGPWDILTDRSLSNKYNMYPFVTIDTNMSVNEQCSVLHWAHYDHIKPWTINKWEQQTIARPDESKFTIEDHAHGTLPNAGVNYSALFPDHKEAVEVWKEYTTKNPGAASIRYPNGGDKIGNIPILQDKFAYLIWDSYKQMMDDELSE